MDSLIKEHQQKMGMRNPFGKLYPIGTCYNPNLLCDKRSFTQLLGSSINERRERTVKLRSKR
jgi:hypothetical protein